nr:integrase, catalytic region, zinc finger, CCHC-type, peptidase aspartic, catalytic [Tanacetum cinerariifolium]
MLCRPNPYYNELNKVAIGYKNLLCLTRAKQVQPALYDGHEIIKDNHVSSIVHNTEDTLEIAEITRRKMNDKMKDTECVNHRVKIAPHDYSKENFLATFTPQKQLIPEQIFWSQYLIKMKSEALKEQTTASRPIKALRVYPPNTPATLVPRARCLELEAELSNLCDKSHNDNHDELVSRFSNLEVHHLNLQLKYQKRKDSFGNNPPTPDKDTPDFDSVFVIGKMVENDKIKKHYKELYDSIKITRSKHIEQVTTLTTKNVNLKAQILNTVNSVSKDHVKPKVLAPGKYDVDVEPIPSRLRNNRNAHLDYLRHLKESVETIRDIVEEAKVIRPLDSLIVSACRYTKHSQELLEYAIGTCPQDFHQRDKKHASAPLIRKKQVTFAKQCDKLNSNTYKHVEKLNTEKTNVHVPPSTGVNRCTDASGSQPRSNIKKNRISPAKGRTDRPLVFRLWLLKTYDGDSSRLMNFVKKFIWTVRFGNDHFGAIMGYEDYVIGDSFISRVYYVEGLGHNLFSARQFCDSDLEVAFRKYSCYVRDTDGVELIKGSRGSNLYTISIEDMMKSSPICLLSKASKNKSWLWHRRLNHLNFGTINDLARKDLVRGLPRLKFEKDHLCSACPLEKSKKHTH